MCSFFLEAIIFVPLLSVPTVLLYLLLLSQEATDLAAAAEPRVASGELVCTGRHILDQDTVSLQRYFLLHSSEDVSSSHF